MGRMSWRILRLGALACAAGFPAAGMAAPFTPGTLVVSQSGTNPDPTGDPSISPLRLVEFTTAGAATGNVIQLPTLDTPSGTGTNYAIVGSPSPLTLYGSLSRSTDGRYLTISAANVPVTTASSALVGGVFATVSASNRTIARIDAAGGVDSTTRFSARGTTPRAAVTTDGTSFVWSADTGSGDTGGIRTISLGGTATGAILTGVSTSTVSRSTTQGIGIFNDQLYVAYNTATFRGVYKFGTGVPSGTSVGPLPATVVVGGTAVTDFFFADPATLYVAVSDTSPAITGRGLQKWTYSAQTGTWSNAWSQLPDGTLGLRGITGMVVGGNVDIFGVTLAGTSSSQPNALLKLSDTLQGSSFPSAGFSTLATSAANTLFRGVELAPVPEPTAIALGGAGIALLVAARRRLRRR
jgi:hypothetical protein